MKNLSKFQKVLCAVNLEWYLTKFEKNKVFGTDGHYMGTIVK